MIKTIIAAIIAGAIFFLWNSFSWGQLPLHSKTMQVLENEQVLAETINSALPESGIYVLPNIYHAANTAEMNRAKKRLKDGPFVFISINKNGADGSMAKTMRLTLLNNVVIALLIALLLSCTSGLNYFARVLFVVAAGFTGGLIGYVPYSIWWEFPASYTILMLVDLIIGWFLAGLLIARFAGREVTDEMHH